MYTPAGVRTKTKLLASRFEKAVDAILWNQAEMIIEKTNKIINTQEEIMRRLQGDNMTDEDDHYYPYEK
jgi:hypothetical protein